MMGTPTPDAPDPTAARRRVWRVGLTGGIASGKTAVAGMFAELGIPVIDTDLIARQIVSPGSPALQEIVAAFGAGVLQADGSLDRPKLREIVFADPTRRRQLEAITHPRIGTAMAAQCEQAGGPYQVVVVPLLIESGFDRHVDRVLVVDCPEDLQLSRLMMRDGDDPLRAKQLLAAQLSRAGRLSRADDVVDNSGPLALTRQRVVELDARYRELAGRQHLPSPGSVAQNAGKTTATD
jgi:dephospho-CoA kinase